VWNFETGELSMTVPWVDTNEDFTSVVREKAAIAHSSAARSRSNSRSTPSAPVPVAASPSSMLYAAALSRGSDAGDPPLLLVGGSGMNEAKVFSLPQLLAAAAPAAAPPPPLKGDAARSAAGRKDAPPPGPPPPTPLVASVYGLARGVFTADWAGEGVFVVAGGDAGAKVMRVALPGGRWPPEKAHRDGDVAGDGAWANGDSLEIDFGLHSPGKPIPLPRRKAAGADAAGGSGAGGGAAGAAVSAAGGVDAAGADGGGGHGSGGATGAAVPPGFSSPTRMARGGAALRAAMAARNEAEGATGVPTDAEILAQYGGEDVDDVALTTTDNTPMTSPIMSPPSGGGGAR
jgi:hypothetical protein